MNTCDTCEYRNEIGNCRHIKIAEDTGDYTVVAKQDMLLYSYDEGGNFWVGPRFGCVHHLNKFRMNSRYPIDESDC